jgi:hypothetical protein
MSIYAAIIYAARARHRVTTCFARRCAQILAKLSLTFPGERERKALIAGEIGQLDAIGANDFPIDNLVCLELLGLTLESYRAKLGAAEKLD